MNKHIVCIPQIMHIGSYEVQPNDNINSKPQEKCDYFYTYIFT